MSNITLNMNQISIEINGNLHFSQTGNGETLHTVSNVKINIFQIKIFNEIILLFIIGSFVKFKVLASLPMVHLVLRMYCNWPTDQLLITVQLG